MTASRTGATPLDDATDATLLSLSRVALETMSHGLCMFDAAGRIMLFNRRFLDLYDLSADTIRPGISTRQMLEHGAERGNIRPAQFDAFCRSYEAQLAAGQPFVWRKQLPDGRTVMMDYRRLPDGGWVGLFEDVSDVTKLERELRNQFERLDLAVSTMSYGIAMFGPDERLTMCNDQYHSMYNQDPAVVQPGILYRDILAYAVGNGSHPELTLDELYEMRMAPVRRHEVATMELTMDDGRVIQSTCRPTSDGGWVADHQDVTEQRRAERALREKNVLLDATLDSMSHGLCAFDADLKLVMCNDRFLKLYELTESMVPAGMHIADVAQFCGSLDGPGQRTTDEVVAEIKAQMADPTQPTRRRTSKSGRTLAIRYRPMADGGWVGTYEDVTDLERAEAEVREQNRRFDAALENMAQGLTLLDRDLRLVACNQRYIELYGFDSARVKPGILLRDIINHGIEIGAFTPEGGDKVFAAYEQQNRIGRGGVALRRLGNGRVIEVRNEPMPNGGWVTTCEDITERERAAEVLQEQNRRFDLALENMAHGLALYDQDLRLVVCNRRYLAMYGLTPEDTKPGVTLRELIERVVQLGYHGNVKSTSIYDEIRARMTEGVPLFRRMADGRFIVCRHQKLSDGGWLTTNEDITDRENAVQELREQNLRFDAALENMAQGLCMIDQDEKIIVCNQRFLDIYGHPPELVKPGANMRDVLQATFARGVLAQITAEQLQQEFTERLDRDLSTSHRQLTDGRTIMIMRRRMAHGGWVATYEDITERRKAEERIAHMARHDALTDLPNRVLFREKMDEGLAQVRTHGDSMAVLCLDLDNFKSVNDTLGHPIGDKLLMIVAQRLTQVVGEGETIARLGGDEFAVLQIAPQPHAAETLARRLVEAVSEPIAIDGHEINNAVSIGIAVTPTDGIEADKLMKCADLALYRAKADGRGVYRFFAPEMDARIQVRRKLEIELRKALGHGEFSLVFQPLVRMVDNELIGMEALLRWNHAELGTVSPVDFIPLAEDTRLIVPIGEWVLRTACIEAMRWSRPLRLAVNLSPVQLKSRGFMAMVASALAASGLPPTRLELEITEAVLLQDDAGTLAMLHQLRNLGVRICMDDFGTGYSSLSYLRSFPFDKIKIDRSFVAHTTDSKDGAAIIGAIAALGTSLGIETTAEGVETAEQYEMVRQQGCTEAQGYYLSRPCPVADVPALIAKLRREVAAA
ncbi:MAG: Diguanylate cyclase protein [Xanthobacteraceae bacterium]|nr:Diguanylate cyclase protein [Xanthobacteraceae bacterium]